MAKYRAEQKGIEFSLSIEDIVIPDICPVLGIPLQFSDGTNLERNLNAPSVDRFDNTKGYTKENIRIISRRANGLKSDGTIEEFKKLLKYLKS